ncbi:MAG: tetratricopeptide repeat protein [Planctomycetes bacterium]|nr:tetratricopeptide repeat protein [Planctomycetota bacterium]MBM4056666.1 tetratricopeptide repeat protein [Planctomycetota bacterium]
MAGDASDRRRAIPGAAGPGIDDSLFARQQRGERQFHTAALVADLLGISPAALAHWVRRGLLRPVTHEAGVAWFDYPQIVAARHLATFLAAGLSLREIDAALAGFAADGAELPLDRLVLDGRRIRLRRHGRLVGPGGQLDLPFGATAIDEDDAPVIPWPASRLRSEPTDDDPPADDGEGLDDLLALAADLEAGGEAHEAADVLRAVLQATGPSAETAFALAELLFRSGDLAAARERYYATIEIDPDHLAARTGLGRVLAALGQPQVALAALEGVMSRAPAYPDAHFHAAGVLRALGRDAEARRRLRTFVDLAPAGPWTAVARRWLDEAAPAGDDDPGAGRN